MIYVQLLIIALFPYLAKIISQKTVTWLSPVVLCYLMGILLANWQGLLINHAIADYATQGTILLALPFLLYSTNLSREIFKEFKTALLAFLLCVFSGLIGTVSTAFLLYGTYDNAPILAGMIAAIFSGGIPNMQAVGMALEADKQTIVLMNTADVFVGGIFLVFLTSIAHSVLGLFLNNYIKGNLQMSKSQNSSSKNIINLTDFVKGLLLTLAIIGFSVGMSFLFFQKLAATFIILAITTLSLLATKFKWVQQLKGTFEIGDYLLLMFCVAVGMLANFDNILTDGKHVIVFLAFAWGFTVLLHWLFCYFFKIDRDTAIVTQTAAIYGPVFIGQIASTIGNRRLVFPGIALGLLGIAMGNYVGVFVYWVVSWGLPL